MRQGGEVVLPLGRMCTSCRKKPYVVINGTAVRFCQKCSRLHPVGEFEARAGPGDLGPTALLYIHHCWLEPPCSVQFPLGALLPAAAPHAA